MFRRQGPLNACAALWRSMRYARLSERLYRHMLQVYRAEEDIWWSDRAGGHLRGCWAAYLACAVLLCPGATCARVEQATASLLLPAPTGSGPFPVSKKQAASARALHPLQAVLHSVYAG